MLARIRPGVEVKVRAVELKADGGADLFMSRPIWLSVDTYEGDAIEGKVVGSSLDRDGYRNGDHLRIPADRVCDVAFFDERGRPEFNEDRARFAIGKSVLVGITKMTPEGHASEHHQLFGTLSAIDAVKGLTFALSNGKTYTLPPDIRSLEEARPGEYRLRSSGEVVVDPDYTFTWVSESGEAPLEN
jgi:hypothetical protein